MSPVLLEVADAAAQLLDEVGTDGTRAPEADEHAQQIAAFLRELVGLHSTEDLDAAMDLAMEVGASVGRKSGTRDAYAHVAVLAGRILAEVPEGMPASVTDALALLSNPGHLTAHRAAMSDRNSCSGRVSGVPDILDPRRLASTLTVVEMSTLTSLTPWEIFLAGAPLRTSADAAAVANTSPIGTAEQVTGWVRRVAGMSTQAVVAAMDWEVDDVGARRIIDLCASVVAEQDGDER